MESLFSSAIRPFSPIPAGSPRRKLPILGFSPSRATTRRQAYGDGRGGSGGSAVDEDMIVLRKRLYEMKMAERNYEPPAEWMDWEKRIYASYGARVCEAVGLLQALAMGARPGVALGVLALVVASVPTSAAVVGMRSMEVLNEILSGVLHLG